MGGLRHAPKPAPAGGPPSERCRGGNLPPGGFGYDDSRSIAPPISLLSCQKRNGPCTVQREKRFFAALRCSGPPRWRGSSEPVRTRLVGLLPARAGQLSRTGLAPRWWVLTSPGRSTHGRCSSFRCRWLVLRGRVSGSEKRSCMYPRFPRAKGFPKGIAFPSLIAARNSQLSLAGGRRSAPAQTDPPNIFSFDRVRPFSF